MEIRRKVIARAEDLTLTGCWVRGCSCLYARVQCTDRLVLLFVTVRCALLSLSRTTCSCASNEMSSWVPRASLLVCCLFVGLLSLPLVQSHEGNHSAPADCPDHCISPVPEYDDSGSVAAIILGVLLSLSLGGNVYQFRQRHANVIQAEVEYNAW